MPTLSAGLAAKVRDFTPGRRQAGQFQGSFRTMAIRPILRIGDPRLLQASEPVREFGTPSLLALIADMEDTMRAANGAGLAAPQIGVALRVVIFGGGPTPRYPDAEVVPYTVLVNPKLRALRGGRESEWEGCLSVPGMRGLVPRYRRLRYRGFDQHGRPIDRSVADFHARVVQHEVDHLDGVLYPTRIKDLRKFGFVEELFPGQQLQDE
jgi:peptide deformylase